jgi:ATP synthase protein I
MDKSFFYYLGLITQLGGAIIVSILVGLGIGVLLDRLANTQGIFTVIFIIIGVIGGFKAAYELIIKGKL